jgi:hypothetical protein
LLGPEGREDGWEESSDEDDEDASRGAVSLPFIAKNE